MNSTAIVTVVSNNYLHFARTLMQSVAQQHPQADRFCVIVDRDLQHAQALHTDFQVLPITQLDLPDGDDFLFQYSVLELNTAVKPWALAHLMQQGYQNVVYIDPDIRLYSPMHEVFHALSQEGGADLVLTPHLLAPMTDPLVPTELDIRRAGTYNLGFCALKAGSNMRSMLSWWQGKLRRHCIIAHDQGMFVDQSWIDLVPGLFPNVCVLRHPGYNVAYWNMAQRPLQVSVSGAITVLGQPLVFAHFSGLSPLEPHRVSKYQNRFTLSNIGQALADLIQDYCERVQQNGIEHYRRLPYGFANFDDGTPITDKLRSQFRCSQHLRGLALGQPFACKALLAPTRSAHSHSELGGAPETELQLQRIYATFLDRLPEPHAVEHFQNNKEKWGWHTKTVLSVALSPEARLRRAWWLRLVAWPVHSVQQPKVFAWPELGASPSQIPPAVLQLHAPKPSPYSGLSAPEARSATQGIWVGPRLDLPICGPGQGRVCIQGQVDLKLLSKGSMLGPFHMDVHGTQALVYSAIIAHSGDFTLEFDLPAGAFDLGSQWAILTSASVVPQDIGMGQDTRQLSWRVKRIQVGAAVLIDSARSPATQALSSLLPAGGINIIGYLAAELGLGEAARSLARACQAAQLPYSALDVGFQSQNLQRDTSVMQQAVGKRFAIDLMYVNADQTVAIAQHLQAQGLQSRYRIGYWHWEQPQLPDTALAGFAHVDEVWVPSTFVHDAVAPVSPVPVVKIPHAISFTTTPGVSRSQFGLPEGKFLALVMYDFHSYQYRKNPQAAIAAFRQAAGQNKGAALVVKTINGHRHAQALQALKDSVSDLPGTIFIDEFLTRQQTWDLQSCCNTLISLHRAEGFGLAPAEMMYLGKPVIATGWSANVDFMSADNSFLVRYDLQPLSQAVGVYPAGPLWAEADIEHAAWCLGRLLQEPDLQTSVGARAASDIRRQLNPETVGALVRNRLSLLGFWNPLLRA